MLLYFYFLIYMINLKVFGVNLDVCSNLDCDGVGKDVCGIRMEKEGFTIRLFPSECDLLKSGCEMDDESNAYGIVSMDYCRDTFKTNPKGQISDLTTKTPCMEYDCSFPTDAIQVCGIKKDGQGFRIRIFENKCQLWKLNCENGSDFSITDIYVCSDLIHSNEKSDDIKIVEPEENSRNLTNLNNVTVNDNHIDNASTDLINDEEITVNNETEVSQNNMKNIVVVRSPLVDFNQINESIDDFFAATHVFDLPMQEMDNEILNETTRRRIVKVAGPVRVFVPWIKIPENISNDFDHRPTLSTCYHKCPRKCPDTYAPVCGVPGIVAREPSLMFQNHCFMDVAQCKMYWENKSPTARSSSYVESSFLFCLGDEMNGMYRFLPLIKTLQHMGRLRKRGRFHYKFNNMKFFNNLLSRQPKFMGK